MNHVHPKLYPLGCKFVDFQFNGESSSCSIYEVAPEGTKLLHSSIIGVIKNTLFEEVYNAICKKYVVGRIRIMRSKSKTCLSWHTDSNPRLHYPIKTQTGCFMVIEDEVMHMPQHTWWMTDTVKYHTAMNASKEDRIHLVTTIMGTK